MEYIRILPFVCALITTILFGNIEIAFAATSVSAPNQALENYFYVIPLGTSGGPMEDNLSAYLVKNKDSDAWVALDAGTLCSAIKKIPESELKKLNIVPKTGESAAQTLFKQYLKAYLISHAHLDHISGLTICSTIDSAKEILGRDSTINYLRDDIFNWEIWPNFANEGKKPYLKQYHYQRLNLGENVLIPQTTTKVTAFALNHGNDYPSTAFLLESNDHYLLYFGDTGPDAVEHSDDINKIWQAIAPLIQTKKLHAIFIEVSYPNSQPDNMLFGHLTPKWLLTELRKLAALVNPEQPNTALKGVKIIVTHIKQGIGDKQITSQIMEQLNSQNDLGVEFILPKQNELLVL